MLLFTDIGESVCRAYTSINYHRLFTFLHPGKAAGARCSVATGRRDGGATQRRITESIILVIYTSITPLLSITAINSFGIPHLPVFTVPGLDPAAPLSKSKLFPSFLARIYGVVAQKNPDK